MTQSMHNMAPPGSLEAKDLEHLLHPATNLKMHHQERSDGDDARGVYIWDGKGKQYLEWSASGAPQSDTAKELRALRGADAEAEPLASLRRQNQRAEHSLGGNRKAMMPFEAGACSSACPPRRER